MLWNLAAVALCKLQDGHEDWRERKRRNGGGGLGQSSLVGSGRVLVSGRSYRAAGGGSPSPGIPSRSKPWKSPNPTLSGSPRLWGKAEGLQTKHSQGWSQSHILSPLGQQSLQAGPGAGGQGWVTALGSWAPNSRDFCVHCSAFLTG